MSIKSLHYLPVRITGILETDNFEPVVHARNQQIVPPSQAGVPFDAPCTTPDINLCQWPTKVPSVEQFYFVVIT